MTGRLLTADDLAERWQLPKTQVYRLARSGQIPTVQLGRYKRFRFEAVEEFERNGGKSNPTEVDVHTEPRKQGKAP